MSMSELYHDHKVAVQLSWRLFIRVAKICLLMSMLLETTSQT